MVESVDDHAPAPAQHPMVGVGMPASLYLDEFASQVWSAFGEPPYLVGSALMGKRWRDVDVRLILSDQEWDAMNLGKPGDEHRNAKWVSLCMAYSALGQKITGLPIDFQIQQQTHANKTYDGPRSALGIMELRTTTRTEAVEPHSLGLPTDAPWEQRPVLDQSGQE